MCRPQIIHLAIFLAGVGCLMAAMLCPYGLYLFIGWIIIANIISWTLTCEKCGRRLTSSTMPLVTRGWNWGVCTRCHPRQKK